jgi:hypothetical protein
MRERPPHVQCSIVCPKCAEEIWSEHRHDFRQCECGSVFIDGGNDYVRIGWTEGDKPEIIRHGESDDE